MQLLEKNVQAALTFGTGGFAFRIEGQDLENTSFSLCSLSLIASIYGRPTFYRVKDEVL